MALQQKVDPFHFSRGETKNSLKEFVAYVTNVETLNFLQGYVIYLFCAIILTLRKIDEIEFFRRDLENDIAKVIVIKVSTNTATTKLV